MATVDLFNAPLAPPAEDAFDREKLRELMAVIARQGRSVIDGMSMEGGDQAPIPTVTPTPLPVVGEPYRPMAEMEPTAARVAPPPAPSAAPSPVSRAAPAEALRAPVTRGLPNEPQSPMQAINAWLAGLGKGGGAILPALGEAGRAVAADAQSRTTENWTADLLAQKLNLSPEHALALARNPQVVQALLPNLTPGRKLMNINGRLVDEKTGKLVADYSDTNKPIVKPVDSELVTPTGELLAGGQQKAPAGFEWNDPADRSKGLRAIPGGPGEHVSAEVAGRLALMKSAAPGVKDARKVYERAWGTGDFLRQGAANIPLVGDLAIASGEIGIAQRNIRTAVEAALRTMTGAAAPEQEVTRYAAMFTPGSKDTVESAKQKLDNLETFMREAEELVTRGRRSTSAPAAPRRKYNPATGTLE